MNIAAEKPKTLQVFEELERTIRSGELAVGSRLKSIRALAKQFSTCNKVVELSLTKLADVGLVEKRAGSGTFVAARGRGAGTSKGGIRKIALISYYNSISFEGYFESLNDEVSTTSSVLIYAQNRDHAPCGIGAMANLFAAEPDAFLVDLLSVRHFNELKERLGGKPVCLVHQQLDPEQFDSPASMIDKVGMYAKGMEFLFGRGHRRVALLGYSPFLKPTLTSEYALARDAAAKLGLEFDSPEFPYVSYVDFDRMPERIERLYGSSDAPTAVFGMSDHIVHQFLERLSMQFPSMRKPEALGVYDTPWSKIPGKSFHSFDMNYTMMWREAIRHLEQKTSDEGRITWIVPKLVVRN